MKTAKLPCVFSLIVLAALCMTGPNAWAGGRPAADTIVVNAKIYTVNARQPWAEALAIRGDKIIAVGTRKEIEAYRGTATLVIDAKDHLVLPGFVDCHV